MRTMSTTALRRGDCVRSVLTGILWRTVFKVTSDPVLPDQHIVYFFDGSNVRPVHPDHTWEYLP